MAGSSGGVDVVALQQTLQSILAASQSVAGEEFWRTSATLQNALQQVRDGGDDRALWQLRERIVSGRWTGQESTVRQRYRQFQQPVSKFIPILLVQLAEQGTLDQALFRRAATLAPMLLRYLPYSGPPVAWLARELQPAQAEQLQAYTRRLVDDIAAQPLDDDGAQFITAASSGYSNGVGAHLEGAHFLARAAREHAAQSLGALKIGNSYQQGPLVQAVLAMARGAKPLPGDDLQTLAEELGSYAPRTLQALLPVAHPALRGVLLAALGWEEAQPLAALLGTGSSNAYGAIESVGNSPEPDNGVVDVSAAQQALALAGEKRARQLFKLFRQAQCGLRNEIFLLEAVAGWNREKVLTSIERRQQVSVKAFGLLPLHNGEQETLERYIWLRRFKKESRRYGAMRRASEGGAVQAALHNLAQTAGLGDVQSLEWQMEKRLGSETPAPGHSWQVDDYRVELQLEGESAQLAVWRDEKPLKSIPAAVRRDERYEAMKDAVQALREQTRRVRGMLETWMTQEAWLATDDVQALLSMAVGRRLLGGLILQTESGFSGLADMASAQLQGLDGATVAMDGPLRIAHPYHLAQAGVLGQWQRALVQRRVTQPLRQAFREHYVLTPAEEADGMQSHRFAGHEVDAARAFRLFESRGWRVSQAEYDSPSRLFAQHDLRAVFHFRDVGHYFSENEVVTSDAIRFTRRHPGGEFVRRQAPVPLADVPPVLFSEVMRDADLVVSVAQWTPEAAQRRAAQREQAAAALQRRSEEAMQRQAELVQVLLDDLGLQGVDIVGHYAHVQGKLASYRVHLSSGSVFVEPGHYLCVVPDHNAPPPQNLFLPLEDDDGERARVVLSKIALLLNDAAIKDATILRQIRRALQGGS